MPSRRRRLLQVIGSTLSAATAGCWTWEDTLPSETATRSTATPTTTRTGPPRESPTATGTPTPEPAIPAAWSQDGLDGPVRLLSLGEGILVATTDLGGIFAFGTDDGRLLWRHDPRGSSPNATRLGDSVLVASVTRTSETLRGYLAALDPRTGAARWTVEGSSFLFPVGARSDALYVAGFDIAGAPADLGVSEDPYGDGHLRRLDLTTGEQRWRTAVPDLRKPGVLGTVGVSVARHGVYAFTHHRPEPRDYWDTLVAFDHAGEQRWQVKTDTYGMDRPVPYHGGVLSGADGNAVAKFAPDGSRDWMVPGWEDGPSSVEVTDGGVLVDGPAIAELTTVGTVRWLEREAGTVLTPIRDDTVYVERAGVFALDRRRGTPQWVYGPEDGTDLTVHGVTPGGVLVSDGDRPWQRLTLLDGRDGAVRATLTTDRSVSSTLVDDGRLYVGMDGSVRAYEVAD